VLPAVCLGNLLTPPGHLQHRQDGSVLPDPPQADLAGQPFVNSQATRLVHRDRAARPSQRCYQQRGRRRRGRHTSADEGDQGRAPTLLSRQNTPLCTTLTVHHSNDPIFCRQHEAVADRRTYRNPGNSTSVVLLFTVTTSTLPIVIGTRSTRGGATGLT